MAITPRERPTAPGRAVRDAGRVAPTANVALKRWVAEVAARTQPSSIHWCDGSPGEYERLCRKLVAAGTMVALDPELRPNSYLAFSDPADVARVEDRTFICCADEADAGPINNWCDPAEMRETLDGLFDGCMRGRTMYVVPFCMGPVESSHRQLGVQLTDSAYVAASTRLLTRMGDVALRALGERGEFVRCLHSVGVPLTDYAEDVPWPCRPDSRYIVHFPESREICSFGSGYGGNALLGKKCLSLRIASVLARDEGWMAEHMMILKLTSPDGRVSYIAGAFPSACGKTNLAMMVPTLPGWEVQCIGDDIAWMRFDADGRLRAVNPEAGFFGVAPGTSPRTNPSAVAMLGHDTMFTNCALTDDGDVWWEGLTEEPPATLTDWHGQRWTPAAGAPAAHPNSRFTVSAAQCPVIAPEWQDPEGVPIDAILFGGRRAGVVPLVCEARDWEQGVFMGATMASEQTAAATGKVGQLRFDPFAMRPFAGYDMGDYFAHWLAIGRTPGARLPKLFMVNWFRRDGDGRLLWPGYAENCRVLAWVAQRCRDDAEAVDSPIGLLPARGAIDIDGLDLPAEDMRELFEVDAAQWRAQLEQVRAHLAQFTRLPDALRGQLAELQRRLGDGA